MGAHLQEVISQRPLPQSQINRKQVTQRRKKRSRLLVKRKPQRKPQPILQLVIPLHLMTMMVIAQLNKPKNLRKANLKNKNLQRRRRKVKQLRNLKQWQLQKPQNKLSHII